MQAHRPDLAIFLPSLQGGGAEKVAVHLANGLSSRSYKVDLVLAERSGPYLGKLSGSVGVEDLGVRLGHGSFLFSAIPLARYLRRVRPNRLLAVGHESNIVALIAARLARFNEVVGSEHVHLSNYLDGFTFVKRIVLRGLISALYRQVKSVIAVSKSISDDLVAHYHIQPRAVTVIYNPVLEALPSTAPRARQPGRYLLAVGRLTAQKDYPTLLQAFERSESSQEMDLVILGDGPLMGELQALALRGPAAARIHFRGFTDPRPYYEGAAAFVMSSRFEGLPNVLIEALAHGLPVASTDTASGPREALGGGQFGELVPPGDSDALARAIDRVTKRSKGMDDALRKHLANFTVDAAIRNYESVLFPRQTTRVG